MVALKTKIARPQAMKPKADRVAVPCCTCGKPTSLRVDKGLLEEVEIFHLCNACFRDTPSEAA